MKWKPWGKEDSAQITTCGAYSIHRGSRGWQAWQRVPSMSRIGVLFDRDTDAHRACEARAAELAVQTSALPSKGLT